MSKAPKVKLHSNYQVDLTNLKKITNLKYYPYYSNKNRYSLFYGGAGSGKSHFIAQKILVRLLVDASRGVTHRFLILRKVAKTLRRSVYQLFVDYIHKWDLEDLFIIYRGELKIVFKPNGAIIDFLGLDDREKLKSIEGITSIWIEEATELTKEDFLQVDLRLRGRTKSYKQIIMSFNPISSLHWIKEEFFDKKYNDSVVCHSTYQDNRFIDEEYKRILEELIDKDESYHKIYGKGEWGVLKNIIYTNWDTVEEIPSNFDDEIFAIDFGFSNYYSVTHIIERDNEFWIDELLYEKGLVNTAVILKLKEEYPFLLNLKGYADSAEPDRIQDYNDYGFFVEGADKTVIAGIDYVKSKRLHITKRSFNIIKEIRIYKYAEDREGNPKEEPVKFLDHSMDGIRYGMFTHFKKKSSGSVIVTTLNSKMDKLRGYD